MKKIVILCFILITSFSFSETAEEHYKDAETYSQKSKQNYIIAAVAFAFVIVIRYVNNKSKSKK